MRAHTQNFWFGKNPAMSIEVWAKCVKTFTKLLYVLWFYQNCTQSQSADVFLEVMLFFSSFRQVRGNLGQNGAWSSLNWKNAPNMKWDRVVFYGHFLWSFFGEIWTKFPRTSKICLLLHLWVYMNNLVYFCRRFQLRF